MSQKEMPKSWDELGVEQLKVYGREVAELYHQEQRLRHELEEKSQALEQRIKELTALNSMFQQHLNSRFELEESYRSLVAGMRRILEEAESLLQQTEAKGRPPGMDSTETGPG